MTVLAADRITHERVNRDFVFPVAATTLIYQGAMVALDNAGRLTPAGTASSEVVQGIASKRADNSAGAAEDISAEVQKGTYKFVNSPGGEEILLNHVGDIVFAVDDQTVQLTNGGATLAAAGRCVQVDADGVWVDLGPQA